MFFSALPPPPALGWPSMVVVLLTVIYLPRSPRSRAGPLAAYSTWLFSLGLVALVASSLFWRHRARRGRSVPGQRGFRGILPRTPDERRWAWAVALSAGVIEELLFRGLLLAAALSLGLGPGSALLLTSLLFGVVHLYQGRLGVLGTGLVGGLFAFLTLVSGSLLFPIILHFLVDVRAILVVPLVADPATVDPYRDTSPPAVDRSPRPSHPPAAEACAGTPLAPRAAAPDLGWDA